MLPLMGIDITDKVMKLRPFLNADYPNDCHRQAVYLAKVCTSMDGKKRMPHSVLTFHETERYKYNL